MALCKILWILGGISAGSRACAGVRVCGRPGAGVRVCGRIPLKKPSFCWELTASKAEINDGVSKNES
jgi:hypothetical protein